MSVNKFKQVTKEPDAESIASVSEISSARITSSKKDENTTQLYNGEKVSKSDKIISAIGALEELLAYIGIIKAEHVTDTSNSTKLFLYARLTQIQEILLNIMANVGTSKKIVARYEYTRFTNGEQCIKDLDYEIEQLGINLEPYKIPEKPLQIIPGSSVLESMFMFCRALVRRCERLVNNSRNLLLGISPDDMVLKYLDKLGDYFLALAISHGGSPVRPPTRSRAKNSLK